MHNPRALFPLLLVSMLAACSQQAQTEETVGDPRVADVPATTASSAASQAHRQASAELDAALKAVPADAAIAAVLAAGGLRRAGTRTCLRYRDDS